MPASYEFVVMAKPGGAICNLACRYCYYLAKERLYPRGEVFRMADELLEAYIVQHIEATPGPLIAFEWHGGEPTILGLDFFRKVVALQRRHQPPDRQIVNGIQTNGTLLDEAWCRFLAGERFLVGLSLDGPEEVHDRHRVTKGDKPTHRHVLRAWRLLQRYRVRTDVLCVVHADNVGVPLAVYQFFKDIGAASLQFLPLVEPLADGGVSGL
ncbi:MAG: radical SAM protein, partial [Candidatus Rokubacteria bacterium]|nr:radical SAM protein [Candidatus Rokubacteria bacterium]